MVRPIGTAIDFGLQAHTPQTSDAVNFDLSLFFEEMPLLDPDTRIGYRVSPPIYLGEWPNSIRMKWTEDKPHGTDIKVETAVKSETPITDEPLAIAEKIAVVERIEDILDTESYGWPQFTYTGQDITTKQAVTLVEVRRKIFTDGVYTLTVRSGHGTAGTVLHTQTVTIENYEDKEYVFVLAVPLVLSTMTAYHIGFTGPLSRSYSAAGLHDGTLWQAVKGYFDSTELNWTLGMGMVHQETDTRSTADLDYFPATRLNDIVIKIEGVATLEYIVNPVLPKQIVFNTGHAPSEGETATATYTAIEEPVAEDPEIWTLDLGGADGGTFELGIEGNMAVLQHDASLIKIEYELNSIFGGGLVSMESGEDFNIIFSTLISSSGLEADFTGLVNATSPTLTRIQEYNGNDWQQRFNGELISNIPAGALIDQYLWIRQTLKTEVYQHLTPILMRLWIEEALAPQDIIKIVMDPKKRFQNVSGDLTVRYDMAPGSLSGSGGAVVSFESSFTPTDLERYYGNPLWHERLGIGIEGLEVLCKPIQHIVYGDGPYPTERTKHQKAKYTGPTANPFADEKLGVVVTNYQLTLIHVDDLEP